MAKARYDPLSLPPGYRVGMGGAIERVSEGQRVNFHPLPDHGARHANAVDDPDAELFAPRWAILAMIPLSESAFWGPMAFTIMGGLSVATFLTLFLLPAIYAFWHGRSLGPTHASARPRPDVPLALGSATPAE